MGIGFRGVEMGGAMSIIGFVKKREVPARMEERNWEEWQGTSGGSRMMGDAGEVAGSKVTSMVGQPSVLGKR